EHVTRALATDLEHPALGTVAVLTFAPPEGQERRPATLGPQSIDVVTGAISDALDRADAGEIGAIAMTCTGKVFLAGADLSMFTDPTAAQNVGPMTRAAHDLQMRVLSSPVPILAHLNGVALGGGLEVALMADVRTAAPEVRGLAVPETSLGILPGWGGTTLLQSVVGPEDAARMILEDPARDRQLTAEPALDSARGPGPRRALADGGPRAAPRLGQTADERPRADEAWPGRPAPLPAAAPPEAEELRAALAADHGAGTRRTWTARLEAQGAPATAR